MRNNMTISLDESKYLGIFSKTCEILKSMILPFNDKKIRINDNNLQYVKKFHTCLRNLFILK